MSSNINIKLFLVLVFLLAYDVKAESSQINFEKISFSGEGCRPQTVDSTFSNNRELVSIQLSDFKVEANYANPEAKCLIEIELNIPAKLAITNLSFDWRGTSALKFGSSALFERTYYFAGQESSELNFWKAPDSDISFENFVLEDGFKFVTVNPCGGKGTIKIETIAKIIGENGLFSLRSGDGNIELFLDIDTRVC